MEQMKLFLNAIETDAAFDEEIHALIAEGKITEIVEAAARKGFTITETQFREHMDNRSGREELSEEALEDIAGGSSSGNGTYGNPYVSIGCWLITSRTVGTDYPCERIVCKKHVSDGEQGSGWYRCKCWGTGDCVKQLHFVWGRCR